MRLILALLLSTITLCADPYGPWPSRDEAPSWWVALHAPYLPQLRQQIPQRLLEQFPRALAPNVTVSFTPQGTLPWLPRNVDIDWLTICAPTGSSVAAGEVYQLANQQGIATLSPSVVKSELYRRQKLNKWEIVFDLLADASLAIPILGQSGGVISLSAKNSVIILASHAFIDAARPQVESRLPDPAPTVDILLDPTSVLLFSGGCVEATMGVRHDKKVAVKGTFALSH